VLFKLEVAGFFELLVKSTKLHCIGRQKTTTHYHRLENIIFHLQYIPPVKHYLFVYFVSYNKVCLNGKNQLVFVMELKCGLRSSGMLHGVGSWVVTDASGHRRPHLKWFSGSSLAA
jgi:hypothetical protein